MATTTNYSWTTPDDSALVKDGASAIRSLGTAIDTTVFNNASAAIAKTIVDAKGDIIAATAADTVSRLAVGSNDQVLTADSSTATGLKWAAPAAGGMTLISTTTLTGASVTLSSIPQTYNHLQLIVRNYKPATDAQSLRARINNDSGTNYNQKAWTDTNLVGQSFNFDEFLITTGGDNTDSQTFAVVDFYDYSNAVTWKIVNALAINNNATTSTDFDFRKQTTLWGQTTAISSLVLYPDSGDFTSGTVLLYGVK
jgi:hypothetical protein